METIEQFQIQIDEVSEKIPNKYNLCVADIANLKIKDWTKLKNKTWFNEAMINSGYWWCHIEGSNGGGVYDDRDEFWIGFNKNDNAIKFRFSSNEGYTNYLFENFYDINEINNIWDLNVQSNALKYLNMLIDDGILEIKKEIDNIKFEKVSFKQFYEDFLNCNNISESSFKKDSSSEIKFTHNVKMIYDNIKLPERKTEFSAGYDFSLPYDININNKTTVVIPTGIRCRMPEDIVLSIYTRSSYGIKYGITLSNSVAIIDSDYYNAKNEGHILIKIFRDSPYKKTNITVNDNGSLSYHNTRIESAREIKLNAGDGFVQGIFTKFYTCGEHVTSKRTSGIGSTSK